MTIIKKMVSVAGDRIIKPAFFELMAKKILYRGRPGFGQSEVQKATVHKAKMYHHIRPTRSGILNPELPGSLPRTAILIRVRKMVIQPLSPCWMIRSGK
jgi:hypothetical protein